MKKLTADKKEQLVKAARVVQAMPTDFWKQVEDRMNIRENATKVPARRLKAE